MDATKDDELAGPSSPAQEKVAQISELGDKHEQDRLEGSRYKPQLRRNRSVFTLLFQTLAIAAIPFGEGGPLLDAIYGGGPLSIFVGWIVVCLLCECIALSLAELASRYPTSAGPYYWSYRVAGSSKAAVSFVTCWVWLVGNWTITLSVNFGFASIAAASISMFRPGWTITSWQLLLILYAVLLGAFIICTFGNRYLPQVDMICALWTVLTILVILIALSVKAGAGRHSAAYALSHYDSSLSGWSGFSFFIGLLAPAYTFCAIGMVASMAEECNKPAVEVPWALSLCVPVGCITGLFFILPICFTIPPLEDVINAPVGQVVPYIFHVVMDSPGGGLALTVLVLIVNFCASLSITVCASRASWAIARDDAIPLSRLWARVHPDLGVPVWSLTFGTVIQMLLGLINLGSSEAFTAFVSAGVIALAVSYAIPIALSLLNGRREVSQAPWTCGPIFGPIVNVIALCWIAFELVLFSMPTSLPVTRVSMNYGSVVVVGFMAISAFWYAVHARTSFKGPLASVEMI